MERDYGQAPADGVRLPLPEKNKRRALAQRLILFLASPTGFEPVLPA